MSLLLFLQPIQAANGGVSPELRDSLNLRCIVATVLCTMNVVGIEMFMLNYGVTRIFPVFSSSIYIFTFQRLLVPLSALSAQQVSLTPHTTQQSSQQDSQIAEHRSPTCWSQSLSSITLRRAPEPALLAEHSLPSVKDDTICGLFPVEYF